MKGIRITVFCAILMFSINTAYAGVLFQESFEDNNFNSRGWYDGTGGALSSTEHSPGSAHSLQYHLLQGGSTPLSGTPGRHKFTPTETLYISYWVKYSSNFTEQSGGYGHHEMMIMTNADTDYTGPAWSHSTTCIEERYGNLNISFQDGRNIDTAHINQDIHTTTQARGLFGCNGSSDSYPTGICYQSGVNWYNGKFWVSSNTPITYGVWHHIEIYLQENTITGITANQDGQIKTWVDGQLINSWINVVLRTGANADQKFNQFMISPYMGNSSPVDQFIWYDDLIVATDRPSVPDKVAPTAPTGVQIQVLP
jgi:hypothetical protein